MKVKLSLVVFFIIIFYKSESQDLKYARFIIDTLTSGYFGGRGYDSRNDLKAAHFIADCIKKNRVKPVGADYLYPVYFPCNTFQGQYEMEIDGKKLEPGKDFLFDFSSPSLSGTFDIFHLSAKIIADSAKFDSVSRLKFSNIFLLIDTFGLHRPEFGGMYRKIITDNFFNAAGVIRISENTPSSAPSLYPAKFVSVVLKKSSISELPRKISIVLETTFIENVESNNIVGRLSGKSDSMIVFSAHYDHLGQAGKNHFFPGANDNASGVSMVLDLARHFSKLKKKPKYTMVFIFFTGEELGLLGSRFFTENPPFSLQRIKFLVNLDMVGSGEKGIQIVNSTVFKRETSILEKINNEKHYLTAIKKRGAAANSDHYFFYEKGVPCYFIYTLGEYKEYHNTNDCSKNLPLTEYNDLFRLLTDFVERI